MGSPGGRHEQNESLALSARRELEEETDINASEIEKLDCNQIITEREVEFEFHIFGLLLDSRREVSLSKEHSEYCWAEIGNLDSFNTVEGFDHDVKVMKNWLQNLGRL